jgi:hypothetical protein
MLLVEEDDSTVWIKCQAGDGIGCGAVRCGMFRLDGGVYIESCLGDGALPFFLYIPTAHKSRCEDFV